MSSTSAGFGGGWSTAEASWGGQRPFAVNGREGGRIAIICTQASSDYRLYCKHVRSDDSSEVVQLLLVLPPSQQQSHANCVWKLHTPYLHTTPHIPHLHTTHPSPSHYTPLTFTPHTLHLHINEPWGSGWGSALWLGHEPAGELSPQGQKGSCIPTPSSSSAWRAHSTFFQRKTSSCWGNVLEREHCVPSNGKTVGGQGGLEASGISRVSCPIWTRGITMILTTGRERTGYSGWAQSAHTYVHTYVQKCTGRQLVEMLSRCYVRTYVRM